VAHNVNWTSEGNTLCQSGNILEMMQDRDVIAIDH